MLYAFSSGASAFQLAHGYGIFAMIGDAQRTNRWLLAGTITNGLIAVFCIIGWHLMRRRLPGSLAMGALVVMIGAIIIGQRSLLYLLGGAGFAEWSDLVTMVPLLLYAIIYAYLECRRPAA